MENSQNWCTEENFIPIQGVFQAKCSCCGKTFYTNNFCQDVCEDCLVEYNQFMAVPSLEFEF